jgi:hypothetical protein
MRIAKVEIPLYTIDELQGNAKNRVIEEHRRILTSEHVSFQGDTEQLRAERALEAENDEYVIENIRLNEYLFFKNGEFAPTVTYSDNHPRAGITELKLFGQVYKI